MLIKFIEDNFIPIFTSIVGAGGFFDSYRQRKKRKADALESMQKAYDRYVEDANARYEELRIELKNLKQSHKKEIEAINQSRKQEIIDLKNELSKKYEYEIEKIKKLHADEIMELKKVWQQKNAR